MSDFKIKSLLLFCICSFSIVMAQSHDQVSFEISPNTGFMDGSGEFGLDLSMNYSAVNLEFSGAQVIGETADLYPLNVNLVLNLTGQKKLVPYGLVGVGMLLTVPTTAIGSETVSSPGINYGGGFRFYFSDTFGLRVGVSQYLTNIKSRRDRTEELLIFQEVSLGLIFVLK